MTDENLSICSDEESRDAEIPSIGLQRSLPPLSQFELPLFELPTVIPFLNKENQAPYERSHCLDKLLTEELIADKQKPREDLLATQSANKANDPYAEFDFETPTLPIKNVHTPLKDADFFQSPMPVRTPSSSLRTPIARSKSVGLRMSETKRNRLLNRYKKLLGSRSTSSDDDSRYTPRTTSRARLIKTPRGSLLVNASGESKASFADEDDSTPHRPGLRPRKRPWIEQNESSLSDLHESLVEDKKEKDETEEKGEDEQIEAAGRKIKKAVKRRSNKTNTKTTSRRKTIDTSGTEAETPISSRKRKQRPPVTPSDDIVDSIAKRVKANARITSNMRVSYKESQIRNDETPKGRKKSTTPRSRKSGWATDR